MTQPGVLTKKQAQAFLKKLKCDMDERERKTGQKYMR